MIINSDKWEYGCNNKEGGWNARAGIAKSAQSFSDRSFVMDVRVGCPCHNSCLFFQDLDGLTEVFNQMSTGISGPNLPLWAYFWFPKVGSIPVTTTTKIFPKVLRYKWEAYRNTNGRRIAIQMGRVLTAFPFPQSVRALEVLRYKWEAYCNTKLEVYCDPFLRSSGGWGVLIFFCS